MAKKLKHHCPIAHRYARLVMETCEHCGGDWWPVDERCDCSVAGDDEWFDDELDDWEAGDLDGDSLWRALHV